MPIYEYRCGACGHEFEEWQKMSDKPVRKCPSCQARKVERLVSVSSFQLKGGGWYADGYGSAKANTKGSSSSDGQGSSGSGSKGSGSKGSGSKASGGKSSSGGSASAAA